MAEREALSERPPPLPPQRGGDEVIKRAVLALLSGDAELRAALVAFLVEQHRLGPASRRNLGVLSAEDVRPDALRRPTFWLAERAPVAEGEERGKEVRE